MNTLFNASLYAPRNGSGPTSVEVPQTVNISAISADIEENGVRLRLNVVDTPGFGDFVNNEDRYTASYGVADSFLVGNPFWNASSHDLMHILRQRINLTGRTLLIIAFMLVSTLFNLPDTLLNPLTLSL